MSSTTVTTPFFAAQASGGRGVSGPADVAPWEDELPWTDLGQATPQPYREPRAEAAAAPVTTPVPVPAPVPAPDTAATLAARERMQREQAARERAAHERVRQEEDALAWATQQKAAKDQAARERAAQDHAARQQAEELAERKQSELVAAQQAERDAAAARQEAARRENSGRKRAASPAAQPAQAVPAAAQSPAPAQARNADAPRFEQPRRPATPTATGAAEPLLRDSGGGGAPGNPVDQALAQALDLRLMRLASRALVALAMLALLGWGLVWLAHGPWFAFKRLTLQGEVSHNSVEALRGQVLTQLHGGYFTLDLRVAKAAFESSPWVRKAQVRRVWPDRLVVRIEEHQPRAVWEHEDEEDQLVNTHGEVFDGNAAELDDSVAQAMPVLRGPAGTAPQMLAMQARLAPVFATLQAELVRLELSERGSWRATLGNRSVIELGRGEPAEVEQRTRRFVDTVGDVSARFGHRAVESADLRHQQGYALKLVGMGTAARPAGAGKGR